MLREMKDKLNKSKKNDFIIVKGDINSTTMKNWRQTQKSNKNGNGEINAPVSKFCHVEGVDQVIE